MGKISVPGPAVAVAVAAAMALSGCASDQAYRPAPEASGSWSECSRNTDCTQPASVQMMEFETQDTKERGKYILGFVEFDDQGWFHQPAQATNFFKALQAYRAEHSSRSFLFVAFAHGWKHNAHPGDSNVRDFRRLLERLTVLEQGKAKLRGRPEEARKVVGVYLGWRGASWTAPFVENLTFWTRKNTGERVGGRSAKQFLMQLAEYRNFLNDRSKIEGSNPQDYRLVLDESPGRLAGPTENQLILIGHSFGGMLMYHALHTGLMERALRIEPELVKEERRIRFRYDMAKSFGDFVLLVNPAFEGSTYEPLAVAARSRCYSASQRPVMAIVTSKTDLATKMAFPAGRLYTVAQSAKQPGEREAVMHTVGHLDRYITHDLLYNGSNPALAVHQELQPTTTQNAVKAVPQALAQSSERNAMPAFGLRHPNVDPKSQRVYYNYKDVRLEQRARPEGQELPYNNPYLVMSADKRLIDGHNDIWNERFVDFMISFVHEELMKPVGDQDMDKDEFHARHCVPYGQDSMSK